MSNIRCQNIRESLYYHDPFNAFRHIEDMIGPLKYVKIYFVDAFLFKTSVDGAQTTIDCAVNEALAGQGAYTHIGRPLWMKQIEGGPLQAADKVTEVP